MSLETLVGNAILGIDTLWGGDVLCASGTGRFIADSWFSDEPLPLAYTVAEAAAVRASGGVSAKTPDAAAIGRYLAQVDIPGAIEGLKGTIRENIAFGVSEEDGDAALDDIKAAADAANIAHDIESFPEGYNTTVGERGITLSGGQKQRTAIARALLRSPRILILDDALSSVDTHTEDKILNHLREIMRGRTTIFISHRVSTVRNADAIAVLHQGRIVELGTHDQLIARNGYYTDLYNKQLLEEELAEV
jgi:ABC-type transport system involved in cytochrome bd biosynthesis fused ATPase/permease subunit